MANEIKTAGNAAGALDSNEARMALVPLMPGETVEARGVAYEQFVTQMAEAAGASYASLSRQSLMTAASQAARTGLVPDGMGSAYLVAYGSDVVFTVGPRGWQTLIGRLGTTQAFARTVHEGDEFTMPQEFPPKPMHHQPTDAPDRSTRAITHAYAAAMLPSGDWAVEIMDAAELLKARECSPSEQARKNPQKKAQQSPWNQWPERMACAKAWRRLGLRLVALSADPEAKRAMRAAIEAEDAEFQAHEPAERRAPSLSILGEDFAPKTEPADPAATQERSETARRETTAGEPTDGNSPADTPVCMTCDGTGEVLVGDVVEPCTCVRLPGDE